jgi:hypothetical protein|tara:strand:+ start:561 stop:725 length:165 start_codon:yes stop_codon:yes gene_type:complete
MMVLDTLDHLLADGLLVEVEEVVMAYLLFPQEKVLVVDLAVHMQVQVMVHRGHL